MGLFQRKDDAQAVVDEKTVIIEQVFDEELRSELRERSIAYFDRVINENATLFKQDLDATVAHINTELRQHVARQLDEQFAEISKVNEELRKHITDELNGQLTEYSKTVKDAQDGALEALHNSAKTLEEQHQQLSASLEKSIKEQETLLSEALEENKVRVAKTKEAQEASLEWLNRSAQALQDQHKLLSETLQKTVTAQQELLVTAFENNMAQIIEHYMLESLGEQYNMKAQIPGIIKQMEENKQAITDDMKL